MRTRWSPKSEHPSLGKDTLIGLEVRGKCLVIGVPFFLAPKKLCPTPGSFYPVYTTSMIKPLEKATPLLAHARPYPIPKGLQPYKGTHAYTNWFRHLIVQRWNLWQVTETPFKEEMLPKDRQGSQSIMSPRFLPRKIQKRLLGVQASPRDTKIQEIHVVQIARDPNYQDVKSTKGPRRQESRGSPKSKGLRDPCCPSYKEI